MEELEETKHLQGGNYYFQGATILKIVINGNMTNSGPENDYSEDLGNAPLVSFETVKKAYNKCKEYVWSPAAIATVFCVCRDIYGWADNASSFERLMGCAVGTISNTIRNNPYMRLHVCKWESNGAKQRVLVLMEEFRKRVDEEEQTK